MHTTFKAMKNIIHFQITKPFLLTVSICINKYLAIKSKNLNFLNIKYFLYILFNYSSSLFSLSFSNFETAFIKAHEGHYPHLWKGQEAMAVRNFGRNFARQPF